MTDLTARSASFSDSEASAFLAASRKRLDCSGSSRFGLVVMGWIIPRLVFVVVVLVLWLQVEKPPHVWASTAPIDPLKFRMMLVPVVVSVIDQPRGVEIVDGPIRVVPSRFCDQVCLKGKRLMLPRQNLLADWDFFVRDSVFGILVYGGSDAQIDLVSRNLSLTSADVVDRILKLNRPSGENATQDDSANAQFWPVSRDVVGPRQINRTLGQLSLAFSGLEKSPSGVRQLSRISSNEQGKKTSRQNPNNFQVVAQPASQFTQEDKNKGYAVLIVALIWAGAYIASRRDGHRNDPKAATRATAQRRRCIAELSLFPHTPNPIRR